MSDHTCQKKTKQPREPWQQWTRYAPCDEPAAFMGRVKRGGKWYLEYRCKKHGRDLETSTKQKLTS